jgi:GH24 family phage-related lysozyme (muramidase)
MHDSVSAIFPEFSRKFEGYVHFMYLDIKGLVTIGIGNLVDSEASVRGLPFTDKVSGARATPEQIASEWRKIKHMPELAKKGHHACDPITRLRLSDDAIAALVRQRLLGNEKLIQSAFQDWQQWPADAQLGVLSLAWAVGAGFAPKWPKFTAACRAGDWAGAAENCKLKEAGNPGVIPRNQANAVLFANAREVVTQKLDNSRLFYPGRVPPAAQGSPTTDANV